ncbi:MAG TPA: hypothetical protein VFU52_00940 [Gaiellaceae bacterium]|nr:hypothetical protein [Gaiellaceae bacterium]
MTRLSFLSPVSPPLRILEVRGGVPTGSIPIGPDRALVVGDTAADLGGYRVYDMSAALVAVEVESDALLQRVTELTEFPAVGSVLRGVPAVIERRGAGYRLFVPQELSQYVTETIDRLRSAL